MRIRMSSGFEEKLEQSLVELESRIEERSGGEGVDPPHPIKPHEEWAKTGFATAGLLHEFARDRVVHVSAKDFEHGTLRVLVPCKIVLCESISFNPNTGVAPGEDKIDRDRDEARDWFPNPGQAAYDPHQPVEGIHGAVPSRAFHLGFFAAITVEHTEGTIIDLNGFRLSSHPDFAMQQRFHAVIELANQPFMPSQGPANFGSFLRPAKKVWIRNGEIGRSSHHGIHGNSMQDVLISDVTFRDYEVAAISLNGGRRIVIRDCQLEGTFTQVPILGTYSASRFGKHIGNGLIARIPKLTAKASLSSKQSKEIDKRIDGLRDAIKNLNDAMDDAFDSAKAGKLDEIDPLFRNPVTIDRDTGERLHLADANPYGIAIHSRGVLVNAFLCNGSKLGGLDDLARAFECTDITIERVNIAKTRGRVRETLALAARKRDTTGDDTRFFEVITDAAGAVFRFNPFHSALANHGDVQPAEMDGDGKADPTLLGKTQIAIAALEGALVAAGLMESTKALTKNLQPMLDWALGDESRLVQSRGKKHQWKLKSKSGADLLDLQLRSNGDLMHHVNKGALGLFVQAVDGLRVNRVIVAGVENAGLPGSNLAGPYQGPIDGGHGSQDQQVGYSGADARGIYFGACSNVCTDRLQAHGVISHFGYAAGIEFAGGTEHAEVHSAVAGNVTAGAAFQPHQDRPPIASEFPDRFPNAAAEAVGLIVDATTRNIGIEDFQVTGFVSQPGRKDAPKIRIEARLNHLSPDH